MNGPAGVRDLGRELDWLVEIIDARLRSFLGEPDVDVGALTPPDLTASPSAYAATVTSLGLGFDERIALALALARELQPALLDLFHVKNATYDRRFTEFGGERRADGDFVPTGETVAFLAGGGSLESHLAAQQLFDADHPFAYHGLLALAPADGEEPSLRSPLALDRSFLDEVTTGRRRRPDLGPGFPARYVTTGLGWDDLVLHPGTRSQLADIETWLAHGPTLLGEWGMGAKLRPGYRALFYGPPGTGKTMTACLLGRSTGYDVYRIDLSLVVSKYIGETEKNLARMLDQAERRQWILFFDEADALFGKRSETRDAHDRYANQEVAYLLQRIETFTGVAILATNKRDHLDEAFHRRFESMVYFPMPAPAERLELWRRAVPAKAELESGIDLAQLAADHELAGGSIMNVVRFASLEALRRNTNVITAVALDQGIRREYQKEGRNV